MNLVTALAWRNLWRRPQRTILSVLSIAIVSSLLVFMLSFQIGVYEMMKQGTLRIFDGYAQVQPQGYADDPDLSRVITAPERMADAARAIPGITVASPRVNAFAILANGERSYAAAVVGVDPANEAQISSIADTIHDGRYLDATDTNSAIVGAVLARNLKLAVGGKVTLLGAARDGSVAADVLRVKGIYESGIPDLDRTILEMPYHRAQETFAMGDTANTIALGGPTLSAVDGAVSELQPIAQQRKLNVLDWGALEPTLRANITMKYATSMLFYLTLVSVVAFIILNTLLMSVLERTREFGMLLAVGMRPTLIGQMVWLELLILALLGVAIGLLIGGSAAFWLEQVGVVIPGLSKILAQFGLPNRLYPQLNLLSASIGPGAILGAILLGGLVPYSRVVRLTAASAMRAP
jgi:ABC-type lipoprotein release transport system permease subunit